MFFKRNSTKEEATLKRLRKARRARIKRKQAAWYNRASVVQSCDGHAYRINKRERCTALATFFARLAAKVRTALKPERLRAKLNTQHRDHRHAEITKRRSVDRQSVLPDSSKVLHQHL